MKPTLSQETPELSILIPACNEASGILTFLDSLHTTLSGCCADFEVVVIDDGSRDTTWSLISGAAARFSWLHCLRFTRNFGKEAAILAGLRHSRGRAVVVMDADGQHPPELLPSLLEPWRSGTAHIVAAQKKSGAVSLAARFNTYTFNTIMRLLTGLDLESASDYRLLDRAVVDALLAFPERVRFFRGMTVWTGFSTVQVEFEVAPRIAGSSQWSVGQLTRLAIVAITSYSAKPLGMIFWLGMFGMLAAALLFIQALYSWIAGTSVSGWPSLTVVTLFFGSANLLGVGVLGAYLAQIFDEIKKRPEYILMETTKVPPPQSPLIRGEALKPPLIRGGLEGLACSILLALAWLTPAVAGNISFDFTLQGDQCTVVNRGDSSAYYPVVFQLGRNGQWSELKSGSRQAELPPGATLAAGFLGAASSAPAIPTDIEYIQAMLIRFFDQSGVSFGQLAILRPPPESSHTLNAGYAGKHFRIKPPPEGDNVLATWVLAPFEEGIAPIAGRLPFTHRQPPATRIEWNQQKTADIESGAAMPLVTLVHETAEGLTLQKVQKSKGKRIEQRTAWLTMKRPFYAMGLVCGICGMLLFSYSTKRPERQDA